ncbi:MAG: hypothetical protein ACRCZ9_08850 [Fusobacteriaceae bacterium]
MIILSGGAKGSDKLFGELQSKDGNFIECIAFSFTGHSAYSPVKGQVVKVPQKNLDSRLGEYREVCELLGKAESKKKFVANLMLRNMYQISNNKFKSQLVVAVAEIKDNQVQGGTGYAVGKAILSGVPVVVLNKTDNKWYFREKKSGIFRVLPKALDISGVKIITGIGSRDISRLQEKLVRGCFSNLVISN